MNTFATMLDKIYYMNRCLELAGKAMGQTSPNPMVGAVVVAQGRIIGEGYHHRCGEPHAEVNAIASIAECDLPLLSQATLFVNLEPCSHYGKTPPCAELIVAKRIPHVVVGSLDPFPEVSGRGVKRLQEAGITVETGICEEACEELNKRFFTFHREKRPYVFLKWAQSSDGFMGKRGERITFSTEATLSLVHEMRKCEDAILVGTNTAVEDNPVLTCRLEQGKNPIRMAIDRHLRIPLTHHLLDGSSPTVIFTEQVVPSALNVKYVTLDFSADVLRQIMRYCYEEKILSLIVEGGSCLLQRFLDEKLYDELRVEVAPIRLVSGVTAPACDFSGMDCKTVGNNKLFWRRRQ
ncbi:MAG: bifunctional diaminohydroxyphosphoribosylaminopyrimidine deaminase/5-amino-6-(5-phosphoribosylamino)uracil reductase RibD [Paludibacteraceae bacterium]